MRSVAIVGLGWFGYPLARHLRNLGWDVKGSKRTHDGVEQMRLNRLETYCLDLTPEINADPDDLSQLLSVDALVINIPPSSHFFDLANYVQGVQNLVNEALLHGVNHLIFVSSTSVFPEQDDIFDEQSRAEPTSEIGQALLHIEHWLQQLENVDVDIIRFAGLVGYNRHPVYTLTEKRLLSGGNTPVNLVHIDDCVRAIELLLDTPSHHRLYHLSAPNHPTRAAYYTQMAEKLALNIPPFVCSEQDPQRIISGNKIVQELDFVYQYPDPYGFVDPQSPPP